jgi:Restriction endonuclease
VAAIVRATVEAFLERGRRASTTTDQGRAFEDLICYVFSQVPGISITHRNVMNAFHTEEIDVALWNDRDSNGFHFLPNLILVECKNWSGPVTSSDLNWFDTKIRDRGLSYGFLLAANGVTGQAVDITAAHSIIASALRESRRLIVLSAADLLETPDSRDLVHLTKVRLCDLVVRGTIS